MSIVSPGKHSSGKIIDIPYALEDSSEIHPTMDSDLYIAKMQTQIQSHLKLIRMAAV